LRNPPSTVQIVGFRRADQVDPILAAADLQFSNEDVNEIEESK
jgi:aryl-alcohol dehydrogenase-like predicted oxidoreductase